MRAAAGATAQAALHSDARRAADWKAEWGALAHRGAQRGIDLLPVAVLSAVRRPEADRRRVGNSALDEERSAAPAKASTADIRRSRMRLGQLGVRQTWELPHTLHLVPMGRSVVCATAHSNRPARPRRLRILSNQLVLYRRIAHSRRLRTPSANPLGKLAARRRGRRADPGRVTSIQARGTRTRSDERRRRVGWLAVLMSGKVRRRCMQFTSRHVRRRNGRGRRIPTSRFLWQVVLVVFVMRQVVGEHKHVAEEEKTNGHGGNFFTACSMRARSVTLFKK